MRGACSSRGARPARPGPGGVLWGGHASLVIEKVPERPKQAASILVEGLCRVLLLRKGRGERHVVRCRFRPGNMRGLGSREGIPSVTKDHLNPTGLKLVRAQFH